MSDPDPVDHSDVPRGPGLRSATERELLRVMHELEAHQAEVELQSETLSRTRRDLEAAHERYFELYELAPVGYATVDAEGRIVEANLALSVLLQIERRRLVGTNLTTRMSPDDRRLFDKFHAHAIRHAPEKSSVEVSLRQQGNAYVPVVLEVAASETGDRALRVAVIDITNLRTAEKHVREREARLQAILDTVVDGIVTVTTSGTIETSNTAASRLFGATPTELIGRPVNRFMPGFMKLAGRDRVELVAERIDGSRFPAELGVSELKSEGTTRLVGVVTDISVRKRQEAEIHEALTRFRQIADHITDAIFVSEADTGKALFMSDAFETIWGRPADEAASEPWPRLAWVHEEDRERVQAEAVKLRAGGSFDLEYRIVRPDGAIRTVRCHTFLIHEQNRLTGIVRDMTDERALQAELRQAQRLEAIGTLASGVAHDFNNLLMGIGGCAHIALQKLEPEHEAYGYLRRAQEAIMRGASLTRQILRFSDTRRTSEEPVELDAVIGGARELIRSLVGEQVSLTVVTGAAGLTVAADPGDIEQVLLNLAGNARDAMPQGGNLTLRTEPHPGGMVALSLSDTGIGMNEDTKRRVFEPFFTTKDVGKGTGLGLSTVFAVVRRLGGRIEIESEPGEGTTFTLHLPVVIRDPSREGEPEEAATRGEGQTILIVDDDPLIRMTVQTHVESLGYRALTASSVTEALRFYTDSARPIDLVLTDIMMPGMVGSELSRILMTSAPELGVVFMSAQPWQELVRHGLLPKNARLLSKPFEARELGAALHVALKEHPSSHPPRLLRVFVVDDDADVVDAIRDILQLRGHEVAVAHDIDEALQSAPTFSPDVVLCDLNVGLPLAGLDLVSKLKQDDRLQDTAFLALTGMSQRECRPAALSAGFDDVLTKPIDIEHLANVLGTSARRATASRERR